MQATPGRRGQVSRSLVLALMALSLGFMLSNMLRTVPAIAADVLMAELQIDAQALASLTGAFHIAFALGQIPVGVALDRYRIRTVALVLMATVVLGCIAAAAAGGTGGFLLGQVVMGLGCCGLLLCPMTLAVRALDPSRFGLWAGLIQSIGAMGMLVSASPMAWVVDLAGWRAVYWSGALIAVIVVVLVAGLVPAGPDAHVGSSRRIGEEVRAVWRIGVMRQMRGIMMLAFVSFAVVSSLRGLWAGPWLMDIKGFDRIAAGHVLVWFTVALMAGPVLGGMLERWLGHRRLLMIVGHVSAAMALLLLLAGGPGGVLPSTLQWSQMPAWYDVALLCAFALSLAIYPQLFAMARDQIGPEQAGKMLAAVNLAFFAGAAAVQPATGYLAQHWGVPAAIQGLVACLLLGVAGFAYWTRPAVLKRGA